MTRTKLMDREMPVYTKNEELFNMISHIVGGAVGVAVLRSKDEDEAAASSLYHDAPQSIRWYLRIDRIPAEPVELRLL